MNRSVLNLSTVEDGVKIARSYTGSAHDAIKSSDMVAAAEAVVLAHDKLGDVLMLVGVLLADERLAP